MARLLRVLELTHGVTDATAREQKVLEAQRILGHGPTLGRGSAVGVAIGFVQSGKTMSFTTLAALAADNGYRVIVVILGNTHLLVGQNTERLEDDLQIRQRDDWIWAHLHMPRASTDLDALLAQDGRVVLITVLKHAARLNAVAEIFERNTSVRECPVLVVDDEADQASLNAAVKKGKVTPTYRSIRRMRSALPQHLYVQYTATPFAPLLLEPQDGLAPEFAELLAPGQGYTGGRTFFLEERERVVRRIEETEADDKAPASLPDGLRQAVDSFLVGTAYQRAGTRSPAGVSMLVHTSGLKAEHTHITRLIRGHVIAGRTRTSLAMSDAGAQAWLQKLRVVRDDFVTHGVADLPDEQFYEHLAWTLRMARLWVVNSGQEGEHPDWALSPVNILIGGNKLDRGFTVRGLTTTYITRRASGGQADTIEQRARCYGYKASYLDYCRIFAPDNVVEAFTALVHTEADLRESIASWQSAGKDLRDWSVAKGIVLPDDVRPTRPTVLRDPYERTFTGWSFLRRPALDGESVAANRRLIDAMGLLSAGETTYGDVSLRRLSLPLLSVLNEILERWNFAASPGWDQAAIERGLRALSVSGLASQCELIFLELVGGRPRVRSWREPDGFDQLMQGRNDGTGYPGDRRLFDDLQLQVHHVMPRGTVTPTLALAMYVPDVRGGIGKVTRRG